MVAYRLTKARFARDLSGQGAFLHGGRWNSPYVRALYLGENPSLCVLEARVHLVGRKPLDFVMVKVELPDDEDIFPFTYSLPQGWNHPYTDNSLTQRIGDVFFQENQALALKVPSAVVENQFNILVNPLHEGFAKVNIQSVTPFTFDDRLFA